MADDEPVGAEPTHHEPDVHEPDVQEPDAPAPREPDAGSPIFDRPAGSRRAARRRSGGCLPLLVIVLVIVVGGGVVWSKHDFENPITAMGRKLTDTFSNTTKDYPGPGTGRVSFQVHSGDSITTIGDNLVDKGVVESTKAFTQAAGDNPKSTQIQPGFYYLKNKMKASDVVAILVNPAKIVSTTVTIPEGFRAADIVDTLAAKTKFSKAAFEKVLAHPASLGLPSYAGGKVEGYLFPATYQFAPDATPASMLTAMVTRFNQAAQDDDVVSGAKALGYTPAQLVTIASLVQVEGRGSDMNKIARVIDNRLAMPHAETAGFLGIDATINYALHRKLGVALTESELNVDSPYNTRTHKGLPPGPISSPGDEALQAAAHPAKGSWLYYVTVNLRTGKTLFADTYQQFLHDKAQLTAYCETSSAC